MTMTSEMTTDQKKVFFLLKSIVFNYHGLDKEEINLLEDTASKLGATTELKWALDFINQDYLTAFERARDFFNQTIAAYDKETKLSYLRMVWEATNTKGYISEMEATAMLKLARDWGVQKELMNLIRK
ncbi:MAG: hypothetical protein ACK40G_07105 [Cytophagaceae bacterium]